MELRVSIWSNIYFLCGVFNILPINIRHIVRFQGWSFRRFLKRIKCLISMLMSLRMWHILWNRYLCVNLWWHTQWIHYHPKSMLNSYFCCLDELNEDIYNKLSCCCWYWWDPHALWIFRDKRCLRNMHLNPCCARL